MTDSDSPAQSHAMERHGAYSGEAAPGNELVSNLDTVGLRDGHRICTAQSQAGQIGLVQIIEAAMKDLNTLYCQP